MVRDQMAAGCPPGCVAGFAGRSGQGGSESAAADGGVYGDDVLQVVQAGSLRRGDRPAGPVDEPAWVVGVAGDGDEQPAGSQHLSASRDELTNRVTGKVPLLSHLEVASRATRTAA